jgi:hypothetical protein
MAQQVIHRTATTAAEPAAVYALLADGRTWPEWSPLGSFELLDPGTPTDGAPEGVDAIRLFTTGRHKSRERVVERDPGRAFAYVLQAGLALRDYKAVVSMAHAAGGGTTIDWHSTFSAKVPGTGWIYRRQLGAFIGECVQGLATEAARSRTP